MKWFIDEDQFIITRDGYIPAECCPATALYFPLDSDFVKTIIETGLANVSPCERFTGRLFRQHIEERFARRQERDLSLKQQLYEAATLILGETQGDAIIDPE